MKNRALIGFKKGEIVTLSYLKKMLGNNYEIAISEGYFDFYDDSDDEPRYIFTQKGFDFAWEKE